MVEEYYQKELNNLIDVLNKVKDFEYKIVEKKRHYKALEYYNKANKWGVRIVFQHNDIIGIDLFKRDDNDMFITKSTQITDIYHTKGVTAISDELHSKYFGSK